MDSFPMFLIGKLAVMFTYFGTGLLITVGIVAFFLALLAIAVAFFKVAEGLVFVVGLLLFVTFGILDEILDNMTWRRALGVAAAGCAVAILITTATSWREYRAMKRSEHQIAQAEHYEPIRPISDLEGIRPLSDLLLPRLSDLARESLPPAQ